jgi:hypothetical protein
MKRMTAVGLGLVVLGLAWLAYRGAMSAHPYVPEQYVYLKAQKHRTAIPATYELWTFAQFLALPAVPGEYQAAEWPPCGRLPHEPSAWRGMWRRCCAKAMGMCICTCGPSPPRGASRRTLGGHRSSPK